MADLSSFSRRSVLAMPLALAACKFGPETLRFAGPTMGTHYTVVTVGGPGSLAEHEVRAAIEGALAAVNRQMSNWDPHSEISRFNAQTGTEPVAISRELGEVMHAAEAVHTASGARFDTTIGPLIELWGFGAAGSMSVPDEPEIAAARARSGHANTVQVGPRTLRKIVPEAQVYLAAIGKGYGADQVGLALEALGIRDYMVEIGGDLYASGRNPDGLPWQIGIESPVAHRRELANVVGVSDMGLASSGDYRNFFDHAGERFSHIVDPRTGRPVTHRTASATVIADNAMLADAWATALHTMGREEGLAVAEDRGIAVRFAERVGDLGSSGLRTSESPEFRALTA